MEIPGGKGFLIQYANNPAKLSGKGLPYTVSMRPIQPSFLQCRPGISGKQMLGVSRSEMSKFNKKIWSVDSEDEVSSTVFIYLLGNPSNNNKKKK